jgi:hypothetical protein
MLNSIGIKSYFTTNKSKQVEFSNGNYVCKESYDLNITVDRAIFLDKIGFIQKYKNDKIKVLPSSCKKNSYKIINTEYLGEEEVFDITVDNKSHTYWTQGCNVSNCFSGDTKFLTAEGWRELEKTVGETIDIIQDNRVKGVLVDGKEEWEFNYSDTGCGINTATKIRKTGTDKELFSLETVGGRLVKATNNHHFATTRGMVELKNLNKGDELLVPIPELYSSNNNSNEYAEGFICGLIFLVIISISIFSFNIDGLFISSEFSSNIFLTYA